mmetsp:Transcript_16265/g.21282  ORF Transcript_16265/g.21282 Transcript_16265/m.21282 type:complete len:498 (-) Transcript_16265:151-1644(-)
MEKDRTFLRWRRVLVAFCFCSFQAAQAYIPPIPAGFVQRSSTSIRRNMASFIDNEEGVPVLKPTGKKTLYDVLGAKPIETREELKKRYTTLAKICHPDALITRKKNGEDNTEVPDFNEIASAWRVLSDKKQRKRYDRSLRAEEFSENVLSWVGDFAKQAAPAVESFGTAANSIFRKTTASTLAGVQAAATEVRREKPKENAAPDPTKNSLAKVEDRNAISEAFKSAATAARMARKGVEGLELLEKSQELENRAIQEYAQSVKAREELQSLVERRLTMSLHTPGSGLTSAEAYLVLEDFNKTINDDLTPWDRAMMRHTVEFEIQELQAEETEFLKSQVADTQAQEAYQTCIQNRLKAKQNVNNAEKQEEEARLIYEAAQAVVMESKRNLTSAVRELAQAEAQVKRSDWEIEIRSVSLERQSEKIRQALKEKEKIVRKERGLEDSTVGDRGGSKRLQELNDLRNEERLLAEASSRLERMADRLKVRAEELRIRSEEVER